MQQSEPSESWGQTTPNSWSAKSSGHAGGPLRQQLAYAPGLDGVRALAVAAVVIFHLGAPWLGGGFLGVDVFFVLSGFLITSILLTEFFSTGRIDIRTFYLRRARRLLPALFTMLAAVTMLTWIVAPGELHRLRGDVVAALTYCTNWTQLVWNRGYFGELGRPSLLQHLWSLAVEEQFYLIWPLVLVACLAVGRRWVVLALPIAAAAVSLLLMAIVFHVGQDPARGYYGTDTHLAPMLIGAALAVVLALRRRAGRVRDTAAGRRLADACALVGVGGLVWASIHISYYTAGLYRGGYLLVGVGAAALIYAAGRAGTGTARLLGTRPLVWIGQRSYAIYLWHWPILTLSRPGIDVAWPRPVLVAVQVGATLIVAELSFRFVETPIRRQGFRDAPRGSTARLASGHGSARRASSGAKPAAALVAVLAVVVATLATARAAPAGIQLDQHATPVTLRLNPLASSSSAAQRPFSHPVRVSFFGDSQGMTLLINKPRGLNGLLTTSDSTVSGCGVLLGTITSRVGYSRDLSSDCGNWPSSWAQNATKNRPQIAVIEIGAWDVFDDTLNGTSMTFGSPAWNTYFSRQLATGIKILTDAGVQVALMGVPCYRPIAAGGLPLLPERGDDSRTRHVTALLQQAAGHDPARVFMIHPPAAFCDDPSIASNVDYRWDGTHYYIPGAALVFRVITPQLLAIPQPPPRH